MTKLQENFAIVSNIMHNNNNNTEHIKRVVPQNHLMCIVQWSVFEQRAIKKKVTQYTDIFQPNSSNSMLHLYHLYYRAITKFSLKNQQILVLSIARCIIDPDVIFIEYF